MEVQAYRSYTGADWGGQRLIVIPDFDTIVMFNGATTTRMSLSTTPCSATFSPHWLVSDDE